MMKNNFVATVSMKIKAPSKSVWKALTDPAMIKQYFFGTEAVSDWKKGSSLKFRGVWEGKPYEDKGTILEIDPPKSMKYNYWSSFSGTADVPENYANVTYDLHESNGVTTLTVTQDSMASAEARDHSSKNWESILDGMRKLVEK